MGPGRRVRSEETWAAARDAYLAGAGAGEVCARFDLGLSALRERARREGWRRRDQADPEPEAIEADADPPDVDIDDLAPEALAQEVMMERAWRMAARALQRGRLREAQGWTKLLSDIRDAGQTRRTVAAAVVDQNPAYLAKVIEGLEVIERARRAARPPAAQTDGVGGADSCDEPDSTDSPPSRSSGGQASPKATTGWARTEAHPVRPGGRTTLPTSREGEGHADSADAPDSPLLNRAERRRRAKLATRARDGP